LALPFGVHSSVTHAQSRLSANDRIETAVIGIGERGKYLIANLPSEFRVTSLCDFSRDQIETVRRPPARFGTLLDNFAQGDAKRCEIHQDYRRMLDGGHYDAVIIAAPDHHHAMSAILAMQAGSHVYVEKPLAVTIAEGRAIVDAARRYQRVTQVGSQQRTMQVNRTACEFIRSGGLGKVHRVEDRNLPGPMPYEAARFPAEPVPATLEWDLFCGPTPMRAYNRQLWVKDAFEVDGLLWRGWDLIDDYSGHLMTNWGAHSVDMIQYALGKDDTGPVQVDILNDLVDETIDIPWRNKTPPLGTVSDSTADRSRFFPLRMTYADGTEIHFVLGESSTIFHGERGKLTLRRNDYVTEPTDVLSPPDPDQQKLWDGSGHVARPHLENWLQGIKSGSPLNAPPEVGHRSVTVCHLGNLARRLNRSLRWNPAEEEFLGDAEANSMLARPRRAGFELPSPN
jgi:predicted dehydrogenase